MKLISVIFLLLYNNVVKLNLERCKDVFETFCLDHKMIHAQMMITRLGIIRNRYLRRKSMHRRSFYVIKDDGLPAVTMIPMPENAVTQTDVTHGTHIYAQRAASERGNVRDVRRRVADMENRATCRRGLFR